eukprot:849229_1
MHRNIRNKRRKITKRDTILTAQSKMGASNDVTFRSKYRKKTKVLKHEYDPFKDVPIMDIERFIQVMGQLHNRENDTFSDSYVAEQCKTNDCDPSHPTVGNTQTLSHPRSPFGEITDIAVNSRVSNINTSAIRYRPANANVQSYHRNQLSITSPVDSYDHDSASLEPNRSKTQK